MEIDAVLSGPYAEGRSGREAPRPRKLTWFVALAIIVPFWITYFSVITTLRMLNFPEEGTSYLLPRAIVCAWAVMTSIGVLAVQWTLRRRTLRTRAIAALLLVFVGASIHATVNQLVFWVLVERPQSINDPIFWLRVVLDPIWVYAAISAIILALNYSADIREREERIHELQTLANAAQLRALRHQLNPHFLFNTLNAITALISRSRNREAERMTESLAEFLRQTLTLDPHKQITLGEEIELQQLYLDIEKIRFPDRLRVRMEIPDDLRSALVPSLITQPLIENSIKYAVVRSSEPVELEIVAFAENGQLQLVVQDNGGNADAPPPKGARVGLANVVERLRAHFDGDAGLSAGPRAEGGFRNLISLPLQVAG